MTRHEFNNFCEAFKKMGPSELKDAANVVMDELERRAYDSANDAERWFCCRALADLGKYYAYYASESVVLKVYYTKNNHIRKRNL